MYSSKNLNRVSRYLGSLPTPQITNTTNTVLITNQLPLSNKSVMDNESKANLGPIALVSFVYGIRAKRGSKIRTTYKRQRFLEFYILYLKLTINKFTLQLSISIFQRGWSVVGERLGRTLKDKGKGRAFFR